MKEALIQYPKEISDNAVSYGFKTANLLFLENAIAEYAAQSGDNNISVPKFLPIPNTAIIEHLNKYAPQWTQLWDQFCNEQSSEQNNIGQKAATTLLNLQHVIKKAFDNNHEFIADVDKITTDQNDILVIRSTSNEDDVDKANPGGNESVLGKKSNLSSSIGDVIASYVSYKSLSQRLKSGENIAEKFPLSACLIQKMIGEGLQSQQEQIKTTTPISGVIYTDNGNIRLQSALGHGELVVNSKGGFDNYYIDPNNLVFAEVRDKKIRLVPSYDEQKNKIVLSERNNNFAQATSPSINEKTAIRIANFARFIENKYRMRMDLEFVYDPNSESINVVQARPIPIGSRKGIKPCALDSDFIAGKKLGEKQPSKEYTEIKGTVITPDILHSPIIKNKNEILICNTIEEALQTYLASPKSIKAVIIAKDAPDNSHGAGMFTSLAIPVLQVQDLDQVNQFSESLASNTLVIDPQHNGLYQIENSKFRTELIKDGIFKSTLTNRVTPLQQKFVVPSQTDNLSLTEITTLGKLVEDAQSNPESSEKLFKFLYNKINFTNNKDTNHQSLTEKHPATSNLLADLDLLMKPAVGIDANKEQKEKLSELLGLATRASKQNKISKDLYQQIMVTGGEVYLLLEKFENSALERNEMQKNELLKHYLNVQQKFSGLFVAQVKEGVFSKSVITDVSGYKYNQDYQAKYEDKASAIEYLKGKKYFLELVQLDKYIIKEEDRGKWAEFCAFNCKDSKKTEILVNLVRELVKNNLHEYWLNTSFLDANNETALIELSRDFLKGSSRRKDLQECQNMISSMEHQINEWKNPNSFPKLYEEFQTKMQKINELLVVDEKDKINGHLAIKQLYKLVDVVDLSIKSLQTSSLYQDQKEQQVTNFKLLLTDFKELMCSQLEEVSQDKSVLNNIASKFQNKTENPQIERELIASAGFTVDQFHPLLTDKAEFKKVQNKNLSLADFHTIFHQSLMTAVGMKSLQINNSLMEKMPNELQILGDIGQGQFSKPSIIGLESSYPLFIETINIPLREHSAILQCQFNRKTEDTILNLGHMVKVYLVVQRQEDGMIMR